MTYSDAQIQAALDASEIAGGEHYSEADGKLHPSDADREVDTVSGLKSALNSSADVIAIANDATLNLSSENNLDLKSKTLVSYRGWDGKDGALLHTSTRGTQADGRPYTMFRSYGSPRVTGLRIRGPRPRGGFTRWNYDENLARGIMLRGPGGEVDNCAMWGWPWNAVHIKGNGTRTRTDAEVHHNSIRRSYQIGYGYGVDVWRGFGNIHHNYIDETRHAVDGFGWPNCGFTVEHNIFGPRHYSHCVDMHCLEENRAKGRVDGFSNPYYRLRAGDRMVVRHNTFLATKNTQGNALNAIAVRGVPLKGAWIERNRFSHSARPARNTGNDQRGDAWRQVNVLLSGYGPIPVNSEGFVNLSDADNQFGAPEAPYDGRGAPVDITNPGRDVADVDSPQDGRALKRREVLREAVDSLRAVRAELNP